MKTKMDFTLNQVISVKELKDGKFYPASIIDINSDKREIKIHFTGWANRFDEILPFDSDRIAKDKEGEKDIPLTVPCSQDAQQTTATCSIKKQTQEILGNLLRHANQNQKTVLSAFAEKEDSEQNEKHIYKFLVPQLEETADYLRIITVDRDGKKIYLKQKNLLVKKIVSKIMSLLPVMCLECGDSYATPLGTSSPFNCVRCDRGSHSCSKVTSFHGLMTDAPLGLVWMCSPCLRDLKPETPCPTPHDSLQSEEDSSQLGKSVVPTKDAEILSSATCSETTKQAEDKSMSMSNRQKDERKVDICDLYRKGACPHGMKGTNKVEGQVCQFSHPKGCQKYISFGSRGKKGCGSRSKCQLFHPVLCRYSIKQRLCTNDKCTFVHLKGTRRQKPQNHQIQNEPQKSKQNSVNQPKNSIPKSKDPLERLEEVIKDMRTTQLQEMTFIKQEILFLKNLNSQPAQAAAPYWAARTPNQYQPMLFNHPPPQVFAQNHYQQVQPSMYQMSGQPVLNQMGRQQMGGPPPGKAGGNSSCF